MPLQSDKVERRYVKRQTIKYCLIGFLVPILIAALNHVGYSYKNSNLMMLYYNGIILILKFATAIFFTIFLITWSVRSRENSTGLASDVGPRPSRFFRYIQVGYLFCAMITALLNEIVNFGIVTIIGDTFMTPVLTSLCKAHAYWLVDFIFLSGNFLATMQGFILFVFVLSMQDVRDVFVDG